MPSTILVTGATGIQGSALVRGLLAIDAHTIVHALARNPESEAAKSLLDVSSNVKLFKGDFEDIDAMKAAADGCDAAFLNVTPSFTDLSAEARHSANQVKVCAETASIKRVVQSSSAAMELAIDHAVWTEYVPANPNAWMAFYLKSKKACEDAVTSTSTSDLVDGWCIIRGGMFFTNYLPPHTDMMYPELKSKQIITTATSPDHRTSHLDPDDLGKLAAQILLSDKQMWDQKWRGQAFTLAREDLTVSEIVNKMNAALQSTGSQKKIEVVFVPKEEAEKQAAAGNPVFDSQLFMNKYFETADLKSLVARSIDVDTMCSADEFFANHQKDLIKAVGGV